LQERIERVKQHRQKGNDAFRSELIKAATREYEMTLSFLTDDMMMQLFGKAQLLNSLLGRPENCHRTW
jgi:hypothetical protein